MGLDQILWGDLLGGGGGFDFWGVLGADWKPYGGLGGGLDPIGGLGGGALGTFGGIWGPIGDSGMIWGQGEAEVGGLKGGGRP